MNKNSLLMILLLLVDGTYQSNAQGLFKRLKDRAQQVGERVIDKTVDDVLNRKKQPENKSSGSEQSPQAPGPVPTPTPNPNPSSNGNSTVAAAPVNNMIKTDTLINGIDTVYHFNTSTVNSKDFVAYALTLKGTPYAYGSTDPQYGLDCSGFITHVFNHFNIAVPRRTYDFKNAQNKVSVKDARPGDLILFTGLDSTKWVPGHMGIITAKGKDIQFIHASSGPNNNVAVSMLSYNYFKSRFIEIVRVF